MNIIFDWDKTIARPEVAHEAAQRRFQELGADVDKEWLRKALQTNDHYSLTKQLISKRTGVTDERELTILMTDMFRDHYTAVVREWGTGALYPGVAETIAELYKRDHKLAIASTLRQDLIEQSMKILGMEIFFAKVYANTPDLKYSKQALATMARWALQKIDYMVGDKQEDMDAAHAIGAKAVLAQWGAKDDVKGADYVLEKPEDILKLK